MLVSMRGVVATIRAHRVGVPAQCAGGGRTGRKTESARAGAAAPRAAARAAGRRRWVPPSSLRLLDAPDGDATHDVIFRKVRGILNKLTPEKFQKLSDDLLGLQLDSDKVLKGVILLIFEKALDEPKYSSMYAQLCKRLSEEAPNLEPPGQPCTFKLLLLNKCRTEFENRAQAFAAFENKELSPEEEEKRHLAKCKMLGNIKFIGELGKLEILAESILHRCIQNLLARRAAAEHHEDLECLAQLVRTCGRVLDSERGRGLMDQYFARIDTLAASRELAPRIRFMLRDVAELRRGGWVPRAASAAAAEGPVPIQQLRDADEPPRRDRDSLFRAARRPLDDVLAGLSLQPAAPLAAPDKLFGNGLVGALRQRPSGFRRPAPAPRERPRRPAPGALADLQMRPAPNSLLFTANRLSREPPPPPLPVHQVLQPAAFTSAPLVKEPTLTLNIKPQPDAKQKPKKDKGMSKEEACRLATEAAEEVAGGGEGEAAAARLRELQLPDKLLRRALAAALEHALRPAASPHLPQAAVTVVRLVKRAPMGEALRALVAGAHDNARLPALLAHAVAQRLAALAEVGAWDGGAHYPLLLQVLQELKALVGMERLHHLYNESKINLCAYVSAREGSDGGGGGGGGGGGWGWLAALSAEAAGAALEALEERGLGALAPQLRLGAALARQLAAEPAPAPLYRWIKANVEPPVRHNPAFVSALVALIARHVTQHAGSEVQPDKAALDKEKALVETYAPLLRALVEGRAELQLAAVYAAQLHAHHHRYPKGMLLRWFMYLYNLEVCEEEAFLRWREDVTDAYPGKGEALFQVNTWLTWLQQQESEDEEAED